jgi:diguanylate cyclase (GGDEF)-like protein
MSVETWTATHGDDHYCRVTAFLAALGARTAAARTIGVLSLVLGFLQLLLMLTPAGPHGRIGQLLAVGVAVVAVVISWCWLRPAWPTRTVSRLCAVAAAACICAVCLIQTEVLLGLLVSTAFAVLNGIAGLLHSGRMLAVTCTVSAATIVVLAARLAQTDPALAVVGALIVIVANVFAVVISRMVVRMVDETTQVGEIEPLTGLPNRRAFDEQFATLIGARSRNDDRYVAVFVISLDTFAAVTSVRGVVEAKRARVAVGQQLRKTVRREALLAHVGEAEFLVADVFTSADSAPLAVRVRDAIYAAPLRLTASIGVASTPLRPLSEAPPVAVLDELIRIGTEAMEAARRGGGNGIRAVVYPALDVVDDANRTG